VNGLQGYRKSRPVFFLIPRIVSAYVPSAEFMIRSYLNLAALYCNGTRSGDLVDRKKSLPRFFTFARLSPLSSRESRCQSPEDLDFRRPVQAGEYALDRYQPPGRSASLSNGR
jgi:hypothetical protein